MEQASERTVLGFPFGGALTHGRMRESLRGSTTESARGGSISEDAQKKILYGTDCECNTCENVLNVNNNIKMAESCADERENVMART